MNTPIVDFVNEYKNSNITRMHMPGHKGAAFLGFEPMDITEIIGADSLYHADGIIAESERNASSIFETGRTIYSAEGSSLSIKTMLHLALLKWKNRDSIFRPVVIATRNAHQAFIHAAMLLDFDVRWLWPDDLESQEDYNILSCNISLESLKKAIDEEGDCLVGVYITSPDYLGNVSDVSAISKVCHDKGTILMVDNAHGAYLSFLENTNFIHPIKAGADMCCDSAHKTLPVLTGGGYLHINKNADKLFMDKAKMAMNIYGSTSPSYLIMESLDMCNKYIEDGYKERLNEFCNKLYVLKNALREFGFNILDTDPLKITFKINDGNKFADYLRKNRIECEYADSDFLVLMLTPDNSENDIARLKDVASNYAKEIEDTKTTYIESSCKRDIKIAMSIREAMLSSSEVVPVENALGRICAAPLVSCPPAIPIVISGEIIDSFAINTLIRYNIKVVECVIQKRRYVTKN